MNSVYSVVAEEGGREICREHTNEYLESLTAKAIDQVQQMSPREFRRKVCNSRHIRAKLEVFRFQNPKKLLSLYSCQIIELQQIAVMIRIQAETKKDERKQHYRPGQVQFQCRGCFLLVCDGEDLRKIENTHHVNINNDFKWVIPEYMTVSITDQIDIK